MKRPPLQVPYATGPILRDDERVFPGRVRVSMTPTIPPRGNSSLRTPFQMLRVCCAGSGGERLAGDRFLWNFWADDRSNDFYFLSVGVFGGSGTGSGFSFG